MEIAESRRCRCAHQSSSLAAAVAAPRELVRVGGDRIAHGKQLAAALF
jgi:hypothetical protein